MALPLPSHFYPELGERPLTQIAERLLEVRYETLREMVSPYDDNYTRETAVFGRQRNALIDLVMALPDMDLVHAGMDVTFKIGSVPCRFFTDDPQSPQKSGFFRRNRVDSLFAIDDQQPEVWRFIVEPAFSDEEEDRVFFAGYNAFFEKVSEWEYQPSRTRLVAVESDVPPAVDIGPAAVELKEEDQGRDAGLDQADGK